MCVTENFKYVTLGTIAFATLDFSSEFICELVLSRQRGKFFYLWKGWMTVKLTTSFGA